MKKLASTAIAGLLLASGSSFAAEGQKPAKDVDYSFEGPFGTFDRQQMQRGYKVYKEVCAACHSMRLVSFRNLSEGGIFSEEQVKALAAEYTIPADPDANGEVVDRKRLPSDRFPSPFANEEAARAANSGANPPDLSLITKGRAGWYGTFNQLWNGIGGSQYVYSVLTGYNEENHGEACAEGKHFNPYYGGGACFSMAPPLTDGQITFDDGAPNTVDAMAKDVSAFLAWTAEPKMEERKQTGFMVLLFLAVFTSLMYLVKKKIWADAH